MYKFINEHTIKPFNANYIKDESNDTMYVHPKKEILEKFGYMELVKGEPPEVEEGQYLIETYRVEAGKIYAEYIVTEAVIK